MPAGAAFRIIVHRDGELASRSFRIPVWVARILFVTLLTVVAVEVLGAALYLPIARAAARVPALEAEIGRLKADNLKIRQLVAELDSAEQRYSQIRQMLGSELVPDPVSLASNLPLAPAIRARGSAVPPRFETGLSVPRHWPLDDPGYVTRGQVGTGTRDEAHPGIDIAVPLGSVVRASGGGTVEQAGSDPEYGNFVLLQHPEGYESMYGHLSRLTVAIGQTVAPGETIGLSGNSGRSSAPHLHFEIRLQGRAIDPITLVQEGN